MTPCSPLSFNRRFGGTYRLQIQFCLPSACLLLLLNLFLRPWRWRRYFPPKRGFKLNRLYGVKSQKMILFITTTVKTSNPINLKVHSNTTFYRIGCLVSIWNVQRQTDSQSYTYLHIHFLCVVKVSNNQDCQLSSAPLQKALAPLSYLRNCEFRTVWEGCNVGFLQLLSKETKETNCDIHCSTFLFYLSTTNGAESHRRQCNKRFYFTSGRYS
jgi:hypothetical protein